MAAPGAGELNSEIERHFHAVADLDPEARERYFRSEAVDPDTRAAVERLLAFDRSSARIIGTPLASVAAKLEQGAPHSVGPYRVIREIGRGGMGAVYEAARSDGELELRVAVKFVSRALRNDLLVERFKRERQILANLNHPHICRLLDAGSTSDGSPYLVMELIEGRSIDEWAKGRSAAEVCALFRHVCDAVQHAHQNLVVHRDLKPGNVLVTSSGAPKLLDFGIAKLLDHAPSSLHTTLRALTPAYAAPEQLAGSPVTTAADVYGLGCVLYHLLTGHPPQREPGRETPPVSSKNPALRPLDPIVSRAMQEDPANRFATAREFGDALGHWLETNTRVWPRIPWLAIAALTLALGMSAAWWRSATRLRELLTIADDTNRSIAAAPSANEFAATWQRQYLARKQNGLLDIPGALAIAQGLRSAGDYDTAVIKVLAEVDQTAPVLAVESQLALDRGDLELAVQLARRGRTLGPDSAVPLAEAQRRLGRLDEARQAIAGRTDAPAWNELGKILEDSGDITQALKAAESALHIAPDDREYQSRLGQLLELSGEPDRARKQYEAIVHRRDGQAFSPSIRAQRIGDLLRFAPTHEEGIRQASTLLAEFPANRYARFTHAKATGNDEEYLQLLADAPRDADLLKEFAANRMAAIRNLPAEQAAASCADGLKRLAATPHPAVALLARQMQQLCSARE